jgi:phage-related protein
MGFIKSIASAVGNIASTVSKVAGGVANIAGKAMEFLNKPIGELIAPVAKFVGDKVGQLPFVGKFLGPIAENLIKDGAASFLGSGPLGGLGFLSKLAPNIQAIGDIATKVKGIADKVGAFANNPVGLGNFQNIMAHAHAARVF